MHGVYRSTEIGNSYAEFEDIVADFVLRAQQKDDEAEQKHSSVAQVIPAPFRTLLTGFDAARNF